MNSKLIFVGIGVLSLGGTFTAGRLSAPKQKTQIQYVDKIKYVKDEKKEEDKQATKAKDKHSQTNKEKKGHVVVVTQHTKDGSTVTTRTIDYDNKSDSKANSTTNTASNTQTDTTTHVQKDETKQEEVKQSYQQSNSGIDYTFMVGRSFSDPRLDYMGQIGVPLFWGLFKANAGFEWQHKEMFVGATLNF